MDLTEKLATGRPVGGWCSMPSPGVAELLAGQGFDFVVVDTEHAPATTETVEHSIRAVEAAPGDTAPVVRVPWNDHVRIKRVLDAGAAGVMAPRVDDPDEARELVRACRYPPQGERAEGEPGSAVDPDGIRGRRGLAAGRSSEYGARLPGYLREANDETAVIAQIETRQAAETAEGIASVPGVDALLVGPADLSAALGCFREFDDPAFVDALDRTLSGAAAAGVPVGTLATSEERIDAWLEAGFDFLITGTDAGYIASGASSAIERYRGQLPDETGDGSAGTGSAGTK